MPRVAPAAIAFAILIFAAFLIRTPHFGNPAFDIDEEFYLVVGDRMLHGALPFVDIWDRKPIGLFLLYAAIRLLGGEGIYQYQVVATLFAAGTAWTIYRLARPHAGEFGGIAAGALYLLWIETVDGGGGQAPIFYNMFVAGAALATFAASEATDRARFRRLGLLAMALGGVAIQIKYTAVFEVGFFGFLLAGGTLRREVRPAHAIAWTALFGATALAPTIAALGYYTAIGQFRAFWFANFVSIFQRSAEDPAELHHRAGQIAAHMVAFVVCIVASLWELRQARDAATRRWQWRMAGWLAAALVGLFSVGALYFHYLLPMFVPLAVAAAPIFRRRPLGLVMACVAAWLPLSHLDWPDFSTTHYWREKTAALETLIPPQVSSGCMQMFAGPPILYLRTHACTVTRYIFPAHLTSRIETHAVGVDTQAEMRRLLARHPLALVTNDGEMKLDPGSYGVMRAIRDRDYRHAGRVILEERPIDVWVRRP